MRHSATKRAALGIGLWALGLFAIALAIAAFLPIDVAHATVAHAGPATGFASDSVRALSLLGVVGMTKQLQKLLAERTTAIASMRAMLEKAATENRPDLNAEETAAYSTLEASLATLDASIEREKRLADLERATPAGAPRNPGDRTPRISHMHNRESDRPFANLGEQLGAIAAFGMGQEADPRLYAGPSGASTQSGPDGAFLIRNEFAVDLVNSGFQAGQLASLCSVTEIGEGADGLEVVTVDETSRADGQRWGGVQVYRRKEAATVDGTKKPKLGKWESRLEDMMGLAYMTERLIQDAPAMGAVFQESFTEEFSCKLDGEIWEGDGNGECLGVKKSGAVIAVDKEVAQANDTILGVNIMNMWKRVPPRSRARGAWFYNVECEPQLQQMFTPIKNVAGTENVGGLPIFMPPGGLAGSPNATIYSRPAIPIEVADPLGDLGDIAFLDLQQFKLIRKLGVQGDESIHVRFIYGERAFRWIARVNGAPKIRQPLTPRKGVMTLSPFVMLAAR